MDKGFNYYRIKMQWKGLMDNGALEKIKTEDLVYASSYSEAEKMAYAIIEDQNRTQYEGVYSMEIIKTKIEEMLYNNTLDHDNNLIGGMVYNYFPSIENGEGFYEVKAESIVIDERTAKESKRTEVIYTPAVNNFDAATRVLDYLKGQDAVIRKVTFDKAESVLWPINVFNDKSENAI